MVEARGGAGQVHGQGMGGAGANALQTKRPD